MAKLKALRLANKGLLPPKNIYSTLGSLESFGQSIWGA